MKLDPNWRLTAIDVMLVVIAALLALIIADRLGLLR